MVSEAAIDDIDARVKEYALARIRHFLQDTEVDVYRALKGACEQISNGYRNRVVIELIQNAHDAHPAEAADGRLAIHLVREGDRDILYVADQGLGFAFDNFKALCSPTTSTKRVNEAIGNKGVGFLSVFQVSSHPEIYSKRVGGLMDDVFDGFCFKLPNDDDLEEFLAANGLGSEASQVLASMPRISTPIPQRNIPTRVAEFGCSGFTTLIRLPLKSPDAAAAVEEQLTRLRDENVPVQLFLTRLSSIEVAAPSFDAPVMLTRTVGERLTHGDIAIEEVGCGQQTFVVARRRFDRAAFIDIIAGDVAAERLPASWNDWSGDAVVSLAIPKDGHELRGRMYTFLPMGTDCRSPFNGHLDAPFYSSIERLKLQPDVRFNDFLIEQAAALAFAAASVIRDAMPGTSRGAPLDAVLWTGVHAARMRARLLDERSAIVPVLPTTLKGPSGWATLSEARVWPENGTITAARIAIASDLLVVDPVCGQHRLRRLRTFCGNEPLLTPSSEQKAIAIESLAAAIERQKAPMAHWNAFYAALPAIFLTEGASLGGKRILLSDRMELIEAETARSEGRRSGRRPKLTTTFLPPARIEAAGAIGISQLPRAVRRRVAYMSADLDMCADSAHAARAFMVSNRLVRTHDTREVLRLVASTMREPGEAKDPDGLRWDALRFLQAAAAGADNGAAIWAEIRVLVPRRDGEWQEAVGALFGRGWSHGEGAELEQLIDVADGVSTEVAALRERLIPSYRDWRVGSGDARSWFSFLHAIGVRDYLPVTNAVPRPPDVAGGALRAMLTNRAALPAPTMAAWKADLDAMPTPPNHLTAYTTGPIYRLLGQCDHERLDAMGKTLFARQVVRLIQDRPNLLGFRVFRPRHPAAANETSWPSPIASFVRRAAWLPVADREGAEHHLKPSDAWTVAADTQAAVPPYVRVITSRFRDLLDRSPVALGELARRGLNSVGSPTAAWPMILLLGRTAATQTLSGEAAERFWSLYQDAWRHADLRQPPPSGFQLAARRGTDIIAVGQQAAADGSLPVVVVDEGGDSHVSSLLSQMGALVFYPPPFRNLGIPAYLAGHLPKQVKRSSTLTPLVVVDGKPFTDEDNHPKILDEVGRWLKDVVALSLRYRSPFWSGGSVNPLLRLETARIRWADTLRISFPSLPAGPDELQPRAFVIPSPNGSTIVALGAARNSTSGFVALASTIGRVLGNGPALGPPLATAIALLGADASGSFSPTTADYARVFEVSTEAVTAVLLASRDSLADLLAKLRPVVAMFATIDDARRLSTEAGVRSEADLTAALDALGPHLPHPREDVVEAARRASDLVDLARRLDLSLTAFNAAIEGLGPPYARLDRTQAHADRLKSFLERRREFILESLRAAFMDRFEACEPLDDYLSMREAGGPRLPEGWGNAYLDLTVEQLETLLRQWLTDAGSVHAPTPSALSPGAIREANLAMLRAMAADIRRKGIAWRRKQAVQPGDFWPDLAETERRIVSAAQAGGWADFRSLSASEVLDRLARSGMWPPGMPPSLAESELGLTRTDLDAVNACDRSALDRTRQERRSVSYSGGTFVARETSPAEIAAAVGGLIAGNARLLATSVRTMKGALPPARGGSGSWQGGTGGGGWVVPQLSDDQRDIIGFMGEIAVFEWLKTRFSRHRAIDESCWCSSYRDRLFGSSGNDSLGYDFKVENGKTHWHFEVKATTGAGGAIELGSTEIGFAERCRSEDRMRYRILVVSGITDPAHAALHVLPNPRSREGLAFYREQPSSGVRLRYLLPG